MRSSPAPQAYMPYAESSKRLCWTPRSHRSLPWQCRRCTCSNNMHANTITDTIMSTGGLSHPDTLLGGTFKTPYRAAARLTDASQNSTGQCQRYLSLVCPTKTAPPGGIDHQAMMHQTESLSLAAVPRWPLAKVARQPFGNTVALGYRMVVPN